ncbi:hypothetical protein C0989_000738 [Termitomyces sp. Mn162]|nr:hypothetical protein C0989_000738 [Termitomyces sp. Mn162]
MDLHGISRVRTIFDHGLTANFLSSVVIRVEGMRLMRYEKAWRPIVTVKVGKHSHEIVMGVDGQNPNLRQPFKLYVLFHQLNIDLPHLPTRHEVYNASRVDISVWYRSQSKKKAKKRTLVASASHTLGELVRLQENEGRKGKSLSSMTYLMPKVELRLQHQSVRKGAIASRGPQTGATILLKIRPPTCIQEELVESELTRSNDWEAASSISSDGSSTRVSEPPSMPPSPTNGRWPDGYPAHIRRQRQRRGYRIDSDGESYADEEYNAKPPKFSDSEDNDFDESQFCNDNDQIRIHTLSTWGPREWIQSIWSSLLPQYTARVEVPKDMRLVDRVLASFTTYNDLKNEHYDMVFARLQMEWTYVGGLVGLLLTLVVMH